MQHRLIFAPLAMAFAMLTFISASYADNPEQGAYESVPTDLYSSPNNGALPSGQINVVPGLAGTTAVSKDAAGVPTDNTNMLGCGGVGQGEYTTGLYNMPETFAKFQQDVDSLLSRQMLVMNYAMPQTAALFDQLNNFGNQRYQSFQQGCNLDALKQDAKKQYLEACVTKLTPTRKTLIEGMMTGDIKPKEPLLSSMAYAQAWEICSNQYVSDTTASTMRKDMNDSFAKQLRSVENVTNALTPLLCPVSGTDTEGQGCWQTLLIPQVRLCLDSSLGCADTSGYKVNAPLLTMPRFFDTLRFLMDEVVIARRVVDFNQQLTKNNVDGSTQKLAASEAVLYLSISTYQRVSSGGGSSGSIIMGSNIAENQKPDSSVSDFQVNYLNCKDADIMSPIKQYADRLTKRLEGRKGGAVTITAKELIKTDYDKPIEKLALTDASTEQVAALKALSYASLGCTANQQIPMFDPNIMASLQNQCMPEDRYAYYSMAGNDVALAATRDVYRYLNQRLKQAYTRLLTEGTVPSTGSSMVTPNSNSPNAGGGGQTGTTTSVSPTISPELNARLARVVKEVMIPEVESQIERLNDLTNTRGQFAQRIQQIYATKSGCVYGNVLPKSSTGPRAPNRSRASGG